MISLKALRAGLIAVLPLLQPAYGQISFIKPPPKKAEAPSAHAASPKTKKQATTATEPATTNITMASPTATSAPRTVSTPSPPKKSPVEEMLEAGRGIVESGR